MSVLMIAPGPGVCAAENPSQIAEPRARKSPIILIEGAMVLRALPSPKSPAGVTARPKTARLMNGVKSMRLITRVLREPVGLLWLGECCQREGLGRRPGRREGWEKQPRWVRTAGR